MVEHLGDQEVEQQLLVVVIQMELVEQEQQI
jgi:hypothetical protein